MKKVVVIEKTVNPRKKTFDRNKPKPGRFKPRMPQLPDVLPEQGSGRLIAKELMKCHFKIPFAVGVNHQLLALLLPRYPNQKTKIRKGIKRFLKVTTDQAFYQARIVTSKYRYNIDGSIATEVDAASKKSVPADITQKAMDWLAKGKKNGGPQSAKNIKSKSRNESSMRHLRKVHGQPKDAVRTQKRSVRHF